MNEAIDEGLEGWTAELLEELGIEASINVGQVLDLASDAAHSIVRPAAPLTTFIAGLSAGIAGAREQDITEAIGKSAALCASRAENERD